MSSSGPGSSAASLDGGESSGDNPARKLSQSGQSVTSLLSAAMEALNGTSDRGEEARAALARSNSSGAGSDSDYSSDEENLAQAQEDDRVMVANGSIASSESESIGAGVPAQTWTFSCQDLLDMVLESMSQEAGIILAERGISGVEGKQGKRFDYLTVEALATHRNNVTSSVGSNPNLQTFIAGLPPNAQLDSKGSIVSSGSGGGPEVGTTMTSKSATSTATTSPLPPLPAQVVPNVLPLVGTREEYLLMAAEDDGSIMDDLPPFKMQANATTVGVNDFVVVKRQGDTIMMHVRIEEKEHYSKPTYGAMTGVGVSINSKSGGGIGKSVSQASFSSVSASIAITPNSQQGIGDGAEGNAPGASAFESSSAYRYFAPAILGRSSTVHTTDPSNNANTASASRTFASYLGWTGTSTTATTAGTMNGRQASSDFTITGSSMDGGSVFSGSDSEGKEERAEGGTGLPAEFDDDTRNRYFDRNLTRRSMSITEGVGWVNDKDNDIYNQIKQSGGHGRITIKVRKPTDSLTDWRSIREVVITASKYSGEATDSETARASYEALLREEQAHTRTGDSGGNEGVAADPEAKAIEKAEDAKVDSPWNGMTSKRPAPRAANVTDAGEGDEDQSLASLSSQDEGCYELDATGEEIIRPQLAEDEASLGSVSLSDKRNNEDPFSMSMDED